MAIQIGSEKKTEKNNIQYNLLNGNFQQSGHQRSTESLSERRYDFLESALFPVMRTLFMRNIIAHVIHAHR